MATVAAGGLTGCVFRSWVGGGRRCGFTAVVASAAAAAVDGLCGLRLAVSAATAAAGGQCDSAMVPTDAADADGSCCG